MTLPEYTGNEHLSNEVLVRMLDDELTGELAIFSQNHVGRCEICRERFRQLRHVSNGFDLFVSSLHTAHSPWERQQLAHALDKVESEIPVLRRNWLPRKLAWGIAVAAGLIVGAVSFPHWKSIQHAASLGSSTLQVASAFEVDGETFIALPYSNPDLPSNATHIVQMQVPVSSLAEAGIDLEPLGSRLTAPDRAVLADVLLGLDGQPLGVHVLSSD
jgi:hypothetical protein